MVRNEGRFTLSASLPLYLAALLLLLPLRWLTAWVLAAAVHEAGHLLAVRLCGKRILSMEIGAGGAVILTEPMTARQSIFSTACGPLAGLLLIFLVGSFPRIALCAAVQSLYNLLPIWPLDGGRLLRLLVLSMPEVSGNRICLWIEAGCLVLIVTLAILATVVLGMGLLPVLAAAFLLVRTLGRKFPCKETKVAVQ